MTTIIKARDAAAFVALVPQMLGYEPHDSVVVIPFARGRTIGGMRVDVPPPSTDPAAAASTLIGLACRVEDTDAYAVIVYSDETADAGAEPPHADLVRALDARADACGLRRVDALHVADGRWSSYVEPGRGGAIGAAPTPPGVRTPPAEHQGAGAVLPSVGFARLERIGAAVAECAHAMEWLRGGSRPADARIHPGALVASLALEDLPDFFESWAEPIEELRTRDAAPPATAVEAAVQRAEVQDLALLIWALARPALRDIALSTWVRGIAAGDAAVVAQDEWERGEPYPEDAGEWMLGEGPRPEPERLFAALDLCRIVAASAPRAYRTGPLAACAWLSWALGRSTHAATYCEQALAIDPEHGLSTIVLSMVDAGHLPDWAFRAHLSA